MKEANGHSFKRRYCEVCGYTTMHEDGSCLEDAHNDRLREYIDNLPPEEALEVIEDKGLEDEYDLESVKEEMKNE